MSTVSLRLNDEEYTLLQKYISVNKLNMSAFIREAVLDRIEQDFELDEKRILDALEKSKNEKSYSHTEVWKELGI